MTTSFPAKVCCSVAKSCRARQDKQVNQTEGKHPSQCMLMCDSLTPYSMYLGFLSVVHAALVLQWCHAAVEPQQ